MSTFFVNLLIPQRSDGINNLFYLEKQRERVIDNFPVTTQLKENLKNNQTPSTLNNTHFKYYSFSYFISLNRICP